MKKFIIFIFFLLSHQILAEGPPWIRVSAISFVKDRVGLQILDGDQITTTRGPFYFELTKEWKLNPIKQTEYEKIFAPTETKTTIEDNLGIAPSQFLTQSYGPMKVESKKCKDEGDFNYCQEAELIFKEKNINIKINDKETCQFGCDVLVAEVIDENLWVGLATRGEYEWYGSGLQVFDLKNQKKIYSYNVQKNHEHFLVSLIKKNPMTGMIWVTTNRSLSIIDFQKKSVEEHYFKQDFNSSTGLAQIDLSSKQNDDNAYAILARNLEVNTKEFASLVKKLPKNPPEEITNFYTNSYLSDEFSVLEPYFIDSVEKNKMEPYALCIFKSKKMIEYVTKNQKDKNSGCYEKYKSSKLIP